MSCPSSIRRRDLNPRPLERESTPITTRPGLLSLVKAANISWKTNLKRKKVLSFIRLSRGENKWVSLPAFNSNDKKKLGRTWSIDKNKLARMLRNDKNKLARVLSIDKQKLGRVLSNGKNKLGRV